MINLGPFHARLALLCTRLFNSLLFQLVIMASSCSFHGIVGIENATAYSLEKRRFWRMNGFIPLPTETSDTSHDLPTSIFTYGGQTAPPDEGAYFINARMITASADDVATKYALVTDSC
ncbi:hypothetical protein EV702DRAFT_1067164 [Suillus placidus]|uniref:Uncharacterized protein n=1 Tax=Suillus placidus TaxID=48579 RepID=A0A9P7A3M4_9AGAM|nr:hypothetical protein EV702DRAFT_1067164 [Suillus placidus]